MRVIYLLTTDPQTVIYYSTNHAQELIYFDSFLDSGTIAVPANISDHKATYITLPFQYDMEGVFNRLIYLYKRANFTLLKQKNI